MNALEKLGMKETYDTGELIVVGETLDRKFSSASALVLKGPEGPAAQVLRVAAKQGPGGKSFFEFYALRPGNYQLSSEWGTAQFVVLPREDLGFQNEFGIFSFVVAVLVLAMAWRYMRTKKRSFEEIK